MCVAVGMRLDVGGVHMSKKLYTLQIKYKDQTIHFKGPPGWLGWAGPGQDDVGAGVMTFEALCN